MRFRDLIEAHSIHDQVVHELLDQMAVYLGTNQHEVSIAALLNAMHSIDLDVDKNTIIAVLKDKPFVERITGNSIYLRMDSEDDTDTDSQEDIVDKTDDAEKNQEHVEKMAQRAIKSRST